MVRSLAVLRIHVYLIRPAPIVVGSRFEEEPAIILKLSRFICYDDDKTSSQLSNTMYGGERKESTWERRRGRLIVWVADYFNPIKISLGVSSIEHQA